MNKLVVVGNHHIHTYKSRIDHSETILGPFKKLTFLGLWTP
jgi:hypothetical protein